MPTYNDEAALFLGYAEQKGVGFKTLRDLGGIEAVARGLRSGEIVVDQPEDLDPLVPSTLEQLETTGYRIIKQLRDAGVQLIRITDATYPARLNDLPPSLRPLWIFARGDLTLLDFKSVAVVGTRTPGVVGKFLTEYAVSICASLRMPVVSGLARGIDGIAHDWCLRLNHATISVLGTGILRPYPASHLEMAEKIVDSGGLLLSEYMPFSEPKGENFVWRNRIQAAIADCLIAPEWRASSGTAHTVRFARDLGRPTINLRLHGVIGEHERGPSDHTFELPSQAAALESMLLDVPSESTDEASPELKEMDASQRQGALWR